MSNATDPTQEAAAEAASAPNGRRRFLRLSGGAALLATTAAGCDLFFDKGDGDGGDGGGDDGSVQLGAGDIGILNYAYTLEQLEAAFYIKVVDSFYRGATDHEKTVLTDVRDHEIIHREFYDQALGSDGIPALTFNFSSVDFGSRESVLQTAKTFEDLGVAAYNGAGRLLESADILTIAGKIVSVEARHAATIRDLLQPLSTSFAGDDIIDEQGLDRAFPPATVLEQAAPFILPRIIADNLPS